MGKWLFERMGEAVTIELADGTTHEEKHALVCQTRNESDFCELEVTLPHEAPSDLLAAHVVIGGRRHRVYADPKPPSETPRHGAGHITLKARASMYRYDAELLQVTRTRDQWGAWHTEHAEPTPTKCRVIWIRDERREEQRGSHVVRTVALELPPGTDVERHTSFSFQGGTFEIVERNRVAEAQGEGVLVVGESVVR